MSKAKKRRFLGKLVGETKSIEIRNAKISIRPLKIAFLINREVGIEGLRKIIQFNSTVWNGIYNIIIPSDGSDIDD